jgi:hypothetical protein
MAYIEENLKVRSKPREDFDDEDNLNARHSSSCGSTRGCNLISSQLTLIDSTWLKNIEETEKEIKASRCRRTS